MTALVLDCDGVLADTERYGHLPAFNAAFAEHGLPVRWDEAEYAERLRIGGGKERMASLFADPGFVRAAGVPDDEQARAELATFLEGLDAQASRFVERRAEQRARTAARSDSDATPDIAS